MGDSTNDTRASPVDQTALPRLLEPKVGYVCLLQTMDYVFYMSRDLGSLVVTESHVISNYALCYALGAARAQEREDESPIFPISLPQPKGKPTYQRDFHPLPYYLTPARPLREQYNFNEVRAFSLGSARVQTKMRTYNTIPERFEERFQAFYKDYAKLYPSYGRYGMIAPESKYLFTVFSERELELPRYIRLGKFKGAAEVQVLEQGQIQTGTSDQFLSEPVHYDDLPSNFSFIVYDLTRLGKAHAVLTTLMARGDYWEFGARGLRYRLPVGTRFAQRGILT